MSVVLGTNDAVVDDGSKGTLFSIQTVEVEGQTLKESTVTQLEETRSKRLI